METKTAIAIVGLHRDRAALAQAKTELAERTRQFTEENADLLREINQLTATIADAETTIRNAALDAYLASSNKNPYPGVNIRVSKTLTYDRADAFNWAKAHNLFIVPESLDAKAFEKFGKDNFEQVADIAELTESATATIATDLTSAVDQIDVFGEPEQEVA